MRKPHHDHKLRFPTFKPTPKSTSLHSNISPSIFSTTSHGPMDRSKTRPKLWEKSSHHTSSTPCSQVQPTPDAKSNPSRSKRAWKKTKEFFASLGEPPTAAYERQRAAEQKIRTSGRDAFGAINYGPYGQGGPFGGGRA